MTKPGMVGSNCSAIGVTGGGGVLTMSTGASPAPPQPVGKRPAIYFFFLALGHRRTSFFRSALISSAISSMSTWIAISVNGGMGIVVVAKSKMWNLQQSFTSKENVRTGIVNEMP